MRFLVDESTGPYVARWLIEQGHQVFSIMKIAAVEKLLAAYSVRIADQFVVVTPTRVRFAHFIA
jgi:hypothetical protein